MKKVKFLAMMLAAGMFAACSDALEDSGMDNGGGNNIPATGEGYVKVTVNMPSASGAITKANDTDSNSPTIDLDDGLENEYKVNDGFIVFFKANSSSSTNPDENAEFEKAYDLGDLTQTGGETPQVSSRVTMTTEAPLVDDATEKLYALVILNPNNKLTVTEAGELQFNNANVFATDKKLSALQTALTLSVEDCTTTDGQSASAKNSFLMTNSPLSTEDANNLTGAAAKTLVPVTVYETEEAAAANDAARIYVERIVAKVTLKGFTYTDSPAVVGENYTMNVATDDAQSVYNGDVVVFNGWVLNVTNRSSYLVRNVDDFTTWLTAATYGSVARFVGTQPVPMDYANPANNYFRIYWAKDPNYDKTYENIAAADADFIIYQQTDETAAGGTTIIPWNTAMEHQEKGVDVSAPLYCLENTMNYDKQVQNQTTTVLLKTTYKAKLTGDATAKEQDFYVCGTNPAKYSEEALLDHIKTEANKRLAGNQKIEDGELTKSTTAKGGIYDSPEEIKNLLSLNTSGDEQTAQYEAIWNAIGTIKYYEDGASYYYAALIKHFDEDEVAWDGEAYSEKHLGRYGVVRNNWYEININSISGPGDPEIVDPTPDPDDSNEGYINCEINVLSWAKREQGVDL